MKKTINISLLLLLVVLVVMVTYTSKGQKVSAKEEKTKTITTNTSDFKDQFEFKNTENIVFFGDSITYFYPLADVYGENAPIVNSGIPGYKSQDLVNEIEELLYQYNPTKVFLLIGINNIAKSTSDETLEQVTSDIETIVKETKKNRKNAKIYVESIYPVNKNLRTPKAPYPEDIDEKIVEINKDIEAICKKYKATYVNIHDSLINDEGMLREEFTEDGLHVNGIGYARITKELIPYVYE